MHDQLRWRIAVCDDDGLSTKEIVVALALDTWMNKSGACYPGKASIARRTKLSLPSVKRAIAELEKAGYLRVSRSHGGRANKTTNRYQAVLPHRVQTDTGFTQTPVPGSQRTPHPGHNDPGTGVTQTPELVTETVREPVTEPVIENGHGNDGLLERLSASTLREIHA